MCLQLLLLLYRTRPPLNPCHNNFHVVLPPCMKMYLKDIRLGVTSTHNEKCPGYSLHETTTSWMCNWNFLCVECRVYMWKIFLSGKCASCSLSLCFPCIHTVCVCMRRKSIIKKNVFSTQLAHSRSFQQCGCIAHHKSSYQEHWTVCVRTSRTTQIPFYSFRFLY